MNKKKFNNLLYTFYKENKRFFSFREIINPYHIFISEIMLQQTKITTVNNKFNSFIEVFPNFDSLSNSSLDLLLIKWKGLGYNRRAIYLKENAKKIVNEYNGILPQEKTILKSFLGIGEATASSIITYTYNIPTIFIETNIRAVFIYHFFLKNLEYKEKITDKEIYPLIIDNIDLENPRVWYYALMDYGSFLKKKYPYLTKKSAAYKKQSPFQGSTREVRTKIIDILLKKKSISYENLCNQIQRNDLKKILDKLIKNNMINEENTIYSLSI